MPYVPGIVDRYLPGVFPGGYDPRIDNYVTFAQIEANARRIESAYRNYRNRRNTPLRRLGRLTTRFRMRARARVSRRRIQKNVRWHRRGF